MEEIWKQFEKDVPETSYVGCKECKSDIQMTEDGFYTCTNRSCGAICIQVIDMSAEWRFYGEDSFTSNPVRCGMPINPLLQESSFGCKIICNGSSSYEMKKIARYTEWNSMPYKEKARYDEFQHIKLISNNAGIPTMIVEKACEYYKKITDHQSFRGLNRDGIIAASIYIACRIHNYPRTPKEIARIFYLDSTSATRGCKNAMAIINVLEKSMPQEEQTKYATTDPHSFIERYCSKLSVPTKFTKLAQFIAIQIQKKNLIPENTPYSIAAGIIYFISQEFKLNITKKEIQLISDTSEVTINKCYRKIDTLKKDLIPTSFIVT